MKINKEKAKLRRLNRGCLSPDIPAYDNIVIGDKTYPLINIPKCKKKETKNTYMIYNVIVSGIVLKRKGFMPNPMLEIDVFKISNIVFLD